MTLRTVLPFHSDYLLSVKVDMPSEYERELPGQR
jgi:hypothetical protein